VTPAALEAAALGLAGAELSIKWGRDSCYCVCGKMFAATDAEGATLSLKVSDIAFEALTATGRAKPAPYGARFKWVQFEDLSALDAAEVSDWLIRAHALVAAKLPKSQRRTLGLAF